MVNQEAYLHTHLGPQSVLLLLMTQQKSFLLIIIMLCLEEDFGISNDDIKWSTLFSQ